MISGSIKYEGGRELDAALKQLSARVSRRLLIEGLTESAEPMRDRMEDLAPRDPETPFDLKENIVIQRSLGQDAQEAAVIVGPTKRAYYGGLQEFGTAHHAAQPFARPAFDQTWRVCLAVLGSSLWRELAGRGIHRPSETVATTVQGEEV